MLRIYNVNNPNGDGTNLILLGPYPTRRTRLPAKTSTTPHGAYSVHLWPTAPKTAIPPRPSCNTHVVVVFAPHKFHIYMCVLSPAPPRTPPNTRPPLLTKKKEKKKTDLLSSSHKSLLEFIMLSAPPPLRLSTRLRGSACIFLSLSLYFPYRTARANTAERTLDASR